MIKISELAEMRYLRLLVTVTVLVCQKNCNFINKLKIDNIVNVKVTR